MKYTILSLPERHAAFHRSAAPFNQGNVVNFSGGTEEGRNSGSFCFGNFLRKKSGNFRGTFWKIPMKKLCQVLNSHPWPSLWSFLWIPGFPPAIFTKASRNFCGRGFTSQHLEIHAWISWMIVYLAILLVPFLGWWTRDPFKWLSDLQLGDEKFTLNHLVWYFSRNPSKIGCVKIWCQLKSCSILMSLGKNHMAM